WSNPRPRGQVMEVTCAGKSIALYRDENGALHAMEDRCAHRQLKLSKGKVVGCNLVCTYHGWEYDGGGHCAKIPHDLFGNKMPNIQLQSYPVDERYGLIWIFPGEPALATTRKIPEI